MDKIIEAERSLVLVSQNVNNGDVLVNVARAIREQFASARKNVPVQAWNGELAGICTVADMIGVRLAQCGTLHFDMEHWLIACGVAEHVRGGR